MNTFPKLINNILSVLVILILILIMLLSSWLYLTLAQDNVLLTLEDGSVLTADNTQMALVGKMQVFITDAPLDLEKLAAGQEVKVGDIYQRITSHIQILLPCEIAADSFMATVNEWASGAIVMSYTVGDDEPACAISLMIVDHRSPHIPWPEAPELHQL